MKHYNTLTLTYLILCSFFLGATYSHLLSFLNKYTLIKGNSSLHYGIVLATSPIVQIIIGPIMTRIISRSIISEKHLMIFGTIIDGVFCLAAAVVEWLHLTSTSFVVAHVLIRIMQAAGGSTAAIALYVINGVQLSHIKHITVPLLETTFGFSLVVGPAISAVLCASMGFAAPFIFFGAAEVLTAVSAIFLMPDTPVGADETSPVTFKSAAKASVILNILTTINAFNILAYNEATLASVLDKFHVSPRYQGLIFFFPSGIYAITSLAAGFTSQKLSDCRYLIILGSFISFLSLIVLGPVIQTYPSLILLIVSQSALGFGLGPTFVCSYLHSISEMNNGIETKESHALLNGLMEPGVALGNLIGVLSAGVILHKLSYVIGVYINIVELGFIMTAQVFLVLRSKRDTVETQSIVAGM